MKKRFLIGMPALLVLSMLWLSSNIFAKTVSVASYGADGSDAESDHLAFQKALDEPVSATDPLVVEVPAGNYYFDRTIFIHSYTTLKLEDGASLIRSQEGMNRNLIRNADSSNQSDTIGGYNLSTNITITCDTPGGALLDGGSGFTASNKGANLVNIGHARNVSISNLNLKRCYGGHLIEFAGVKDSVISNCSFSEFTRQTHMQDKNNSEAVQLDICYNAGDDKWTAAFLSDGTPCSNIVISGNSFTNYARGVGNHHTLANHHNTKISIKNNTFTCGSFASKQAILMYGFDDSEVSNNTISGNYTIGIQAVGCKGTSIHSNKISSCLGNGIYIQNSVLPSVSQNQVLFPGHNGITVDQDANDSHLKLINSSITNLNSNVIQSPGSGGNYNGITVSGANASVQSIAYNAVTSPIQSGIVIKNGAVATNITANKIDSASRQGINISKAGGIGSISKNTVTNPKWHGIQINIGTVGTVSQNAVANAGLHGIQISASRVSSVTNNNITNTSRQGISITEKSSVANLTSNAISTVKLNGVYISDEGTYVTNVMKNAISLASQHGISVAKAKVSRIQGNQIKNAGAQGISLTSSNVTDLLSNRIDTVSLSGIYAASKSTVKNIAKNSIVNAKNCGICISDKKTAVTKIRKNKINSAQQQCIYSRFGAKVKSIESNIMTNVNLSYPQIQLMNQNKKSFFIYPNKIKSSTVKFIGSASKFLKVKLKIGKKTYKFTVNGKKPFKQILRDKKTNAKGYKSGSTYKLTCTDKQKNTMTAIMTVK